MSSMSMEQLPKVYALSVGDPIGRQFYLIYLTQTRNETARSPSRSISAMAADALRLPCARREQKVEIGFRQHALPGTAHHACHDRVV